MEDLLILAVNPGSTSTKIALYNNNKSVFLKNIKHSAEDLKPFKNISDQYEFRMEIILKELENASTDINDISAVVGRGGLVKPIESGVYEVNQKMMEDLRIGFLGQHASNLGGLIAYEIASRTDGARAFIADPVVVDEMQEVARISGHPKFKRMSIFHALNQKAVARAYSETTNREYEELSLIVVHLGGGISVGAHNRGRVIDVNNALDGEGPFSPERSGTLPVGALVSTCFSGDYTMEEVKRMITGKGGYMAYLDTNNAHDVEISAKEGDEKAALIQDALSYQVSKEIGSMSAVLKGKVDAIILTGGIAYNDMLVKYVRDMVSFIAPVVVYPGEDEMKSLAMNGYIVLTGKVESKTYK